MKISVNYDFFDKVNQAKTGYSLQKISRNVMIYTSINSGTIMLISKDLLIALESIFFFLPIHVISQTLSYAILSKKLKEISKGQLVDLSLKLNSMGVHTNYDLLLEAYKYDSEYTFLNTDGKLPRIEQKKYIMVPVQEDGQEREMSIVQEHIIGTDEYTLSCGTPKRVLKPILRKA